MIIVLPEPIPTTAPVFESTVATLPWLLVHTPPDTVDDKKEVSPMQILWLPLSVPALGAAVTVTVRVAVALLVQLPVPLTVYVMVAVPAATPVTTPEVALTVATAGVLLDQVPPGMEEVKLDVSLTQTLWFPLRVPAVGAAVTVMVRVAVALAQPPVPITVYVMVAVPAATPVTTPEVALTVATAGVLLDQEPPEMVEV